MNISSETDKKEIHGNTGGITVAFYICIFSILVFVATEVFSFFHMVNTASIRSFWLLLSVVIIIIIFYRRRSLHKIRSKSICDSVKKEWDIIVLVGVWLVYLGYLSYRTVPFNWDSMTYHLARVANWIQNQSVDYYATNIPRQLYSPVFAEYLILHLCLIFGNDYAVNLVQFVSYVACLYFLWDITKKLELSKWVSVITCVLFATMPMAIAESMTTQVDLIGCMWMLLFVDVLTELIAVEKLTVCAYQLVRIAICAVAVAFVYLTKSNICFLLVPFLFWLLFKCIGRRDSVKTIFIYGVLAFSIIGIISAPIFVRNYIYTGDILASSYMSGIMVGTFNLRYLIVNIYKNFALLAVTNNVKEFISSLGLDLADLLGVDINAPEISLTGDFCNALPVSYHHDIANNPVVAWMFLFSLLGILILLIRKRKIEKKSFLAVCIIAVIVGLASLRYQVWGSRLLLSTCAIMCMVPPIVLDCFISHLNNNVIKNRIFIYVIACAAAFAFPAVQFNEQYARTYRENKNRFQMYFANRGVYEPYAGICNFVESLGVSKIGILVGTDTYEYPLWVRLKNENTKIIQVVEKDGMESPECIIAIDQDISIGDEYTYAGQLFKCVYNYEENSLYAVLVESSKNYN